jgi:hypothetical protein
MFITNQTWALFFVVGYFAVVASSKLLMQATIGNESGSRPWSPAPARQLNSTGVDDLLVRVAALEQFTCMLVQPTADGQQMVKKTTGLDCENPQQPDTKPAGRISIALTYAQNTASNDYARWQDPDHHHDNPQCSARMRERILFLWGITGLKWFGLTQERCSEQLALSSDPVTFLDRNKRYLENVWKELPPTS